MMESESKREAAPPPPPPREYEVALNARTAATIEKAKSALSVLSHDERDLNQVRYDGCPPGVLYAVVKAGLLKPVTDLRIGDGYGVGSVPKHAWERATPYVTRVVEHLLEKHTTRLPRLRSLFLSSLHTNVRPELLQGVLPRLEWLGLGSTRDQPGDREDAHGYDYINTVLAPSRTYPKLTLLDLWGAACFPVDHARFGQLFPNLEILYLDTNHNSRVLEVCRDQLPRLKELCIQFFFVTPAAIEAVAAIVRRGVLSEYCLSCGKWVRDRPREKTKTRRLSDVTYVARMEALLDAAERASPNPAVRRNECDVRPAYIVDYSSDDDTDDE